MAANEHPHRPVVGVFLKLSSVVLLSCLAACVKYLGDGVPTGQIIFVRGVISMTVLAFIAWHFHGFDILRTDRLRSHAIRSLAGTASMFCWFTALTMIPLADFTAISFTAPMFVTLLAMLLLGERIHVYRWTALAIGFVGVLITIGPHLTLGGNSLGVLVAFGAAVFSGLAITTLRSMSGAGGEHPLAITFYFSLTTVICSALTAVGGWPMPTSQQWFFIVASGLFGVFGQLLMTMSYRYAEASTLAPLDYTNLLLAVALGFYFFGEVPHWSMWVGAPLVIAAGLIILWREYRRYAAVPAPVVPNNGAARALDFGPMAANKSISPEQVQSALGQEKISQFAQQAGVSGSEASAALAGMLPGLVDKLTPNGTLPDAQGIESMIGQFLGRH